MMELHLTLLILVSVAAVCFSLNCTYSETKGLRRFGVGSPAGVVQPDNVTMACNEDEHIKCFAYWAEDPKKGVVMIMQGCISQTDKESYCHLSDCTNYKEIIVGNNTSFICCCSEDHCNANVTYVARAPPTTSPPVPIIPENNFLILYVVAISVVTVVCVVVLLILVYCFYRLRSLKLQNSNPQPPYSEAVPPDPDFDMEDLKLLALVGQGRYCNVYKGILNEKQVAVKIFAGASRECYLNEIDIYNMHHIGHDNLLKFIGAGERIGEDGWLEFLLVTELIDNGSLMSYLKEVTYDWHGMCKLAQTATAGLAHLHLSANKGGLYKPAIVHRDINSRNILVKLDGTCVVGDFGFAMKVCGSNIIGRGRGDNSNITDVGTVRYMAPEVLDGAVNLRDCECALKQVDIYSLGLVLWELATRCKDLYPGTVPPDYKMPFQDEVGQRPSFAEMQVLVSADKRRPAFPDEWKDNHTALRSLKGTIEECWDHDAEARLTALCVEERIIELMVLWDKHRSVTPTINSMSQIPASHTDNSLTSPRLTEETETFIPNEGYGQEIRTASEVPLELTCRHDKPLSGGMEKNERQMLLSPDTISTSLSSPSELNLIDLSSAGQSVDPKNIHHSDDSIERYTTDLKYGPLHKPVSNQEVGHQEVSNASEPTVSPSQGLMVNEMPPPLSRHQMTDNLSGENRRRSQRSTVAHPHKGDINRQRQLARAAERAPPSYEQVTAGDAPCNISHLYTGEANNSGGHESVSPVSNKRPSSLPLTPDANGQRKKMVAVFIPDSGPSSRVETGIAKSDEDSIGASYDNGNLLVNGNSERPHSISYDGSVESEQSMSDTSSRSSSASSLTENIDGVVVTKKDKRRGTPYRLLDKKLTVHNGKPSGGSDRKKKGSSANSPPTKSVSGKCNVANNNHNSDRLADERVGLMQNGNTPIPVSVENKSEESDGFQVSLV